MNFPQILGKNRGCGLYSGATCSPEDMVMVSMYGHWWVYQQLYEMCI